jgi:hypothetical protein
VNGARFDPRVVPMFLLILDVIASDHLNRFPVKAVICLETNQEMSIG